MSDPRVTLVERASEVPSVTERLARATTLALDVESNGLHAYRPSLCTLQLGIDEGEVLVIDAIAIGDAGLAPLAPILSHGGPRKILHDLAFDARILCKHGLRLGNVTDTAIAARFLAEASTGLAALVEKRVGVKLSKELQHHDWGARPLRADVFGYLAADVAHLPALARSLFDEARARDIEEEIEVETQHRLSTALAARDDDDPRPPYVRIKGVFDLDRIGVAVLREVAEVRERASQRANVPPFKVVGNDTLLDLARKRPKDREALRSVRGLDRGRGASLVGELAQAIARGVVAGDVPEAERAAFFTPAPRPPREVIEARRGREQRLTAWRKREAKARGVDEQVVLPGHCAQALADLTAPTLEAVASIPGLGDKRIARYAAAILEALLPPPVRASAGEGG